MRLIKVIGLTTVAALAAMASVSATSALATSTAICLNDTAFAAPSEAECNPPTLEHFLTVKLVTEGGVSKWVDAKAIILNNAINVECNILIEAHRKTPYLVSNGPVSYEGLLVYENCKSDCTVTVVQNNGTISFLKTGPELGELTASGYEIKINCFGLIDCDFGMSNTHGHVLGGLLISGNENAQLAHVTYSAVPLTIIQRLGVFVCPENLTLDALFQSLKKLYVRS